MKIRIEAAWFPYLPGRFSGFFIFQAEPLSQYPPPYRDHEDNKNHR